MGQLERGGWKGMWVSDCRRRAVGEVASFKLCPGEQVVKTGGREGSWGVR